MSSFSLISLTVSIFCALLTIFVFLQAKNKVHYIWGAFNANVALWCLGLYFVGIAQSPQQAILSWKFTFVGNTFIAVFLYHLIHSFCNLKDHKFLAFVYSQGIFFSLFYLLLPIFPKDIPLRFNQIYYYTTSPLFNIWLAVFSFITILSFYKVWKFMQISEGREKMEARYLFWGMLIGFAGGYTTALPAYNILVYPAWHFSICIYTAIFTYAVLRHYFFDIRVGLIRLLIPACIFTIILFVLCLIYFDMNLFSVASLSEASLSALLAFIVFAYSTKRVHQIWAIFNVVIAIWGLTNFFGGMSVTPERALVFWRLTCVVCTFISVVYYHVIIEFCQIKRPRMLAFSYIQGVLFVPLIMFTNYFLNTTFVFHSIHYYRSTFLFAVWTLLWFIVTGSAFFELHKFIKRTHGIQKTQALYMFWAMLLGHTGGAATILPAYGIPIYPAWHFSVCVYAALITYAMFRYQLMDIRIAVTRIGIFVLIYSLILGTPFGVTFWGKEILVGVFGQHWYWIPIILSTIFATAGPFIFIYFQRKAEEAFLQEEQRTQDLLMQASYGMNTIHNLQKLLDLIVTIVVRTLRVDEGKIFLLNREADQFELKAPEENNGTVFSHDDPLVDHLRQKQYPIVYDEMKVLSEMNGKAELKEVENRMRELPAHVIVPITLNNSLLGFLAFGERKSKDMYSKGLLNALSVLGNHAATAIDRCNYIAAETKRLEAEGLKERMVSLDHMASSMAHEIDNPMHIIRTSLSFVKSALLRDPRVSMPTEVKQDFDDSLSRSLNASERVSSMIKAILDYSRMGTGKLESVRINDALEGFLQLIQPQIREEKVQFTKEIENNLPPVLGDRVQMEEVFMNFVRNSLHAVRRNEEKRISLKIFKKNEHTVRIECSDNGYGIPKEIINDIFLSSMTTKGSSEGTGLGLYRVRKIVDLFRGKVWAESEGKGKGATFIVEIPVYESQKIISMGLKK